MAKQSNVPVTPEHDSDNKMGKIFNSICHFTSNEYFFCTKTTLHIKGSHLAVHSSINLPCVHHIPLVILHTLDLLSDADINLRFALVGAGSPSWLILIRRHLLDVLEGAVQAADVGVQGGAQGTGLDQQISELPYLCVHLSLVFPAGRDVVHNS